MDDLSTTRLKLRHFKIEDARAMYDNWASDDEVTKYLSWNTHKSIDDTEVILSLWVERSDFPNFYNWAIEIKDTREIIGSISLFKIDLEDLSAEVGYVIGRSFWNKGYVTEATNEVINYAFNKLKLSTITARCMKENIASAKVMEKNNMKYYKTENEYSSKYKKLIPLDHYILRKEELL